MQSQQTKQFGQRRLRAKASSNRQKPFCLGGRVGRTARNEVVIYIYITELTNTCKYTYLYVYVHVNMIIEGSLEVKLPTIWTDE